MRIAVDFDDVLNRLIEATVYKINYLYDKDYKIEDIKGWNILDYIDITEEQLFGIWTPKFMENVPLKQDAKLFINELKSRGHQVIIATACFSEIHTQREKVCIEQLGLDVEDIVFIKKKYLLDVDILIYDCVQNMKDEYDLPIKPEKIILDRPHNKDAKGLGFYYRASDLNETLEIVDIIEKNKKTKNRTP